MTTGHNSNIPKATLLGIELDSFIPITHQQPRYSRLVGNLPFANYNPAFSLALLKGNNDQIRAISQIGGTSVSKFPLLPLIDRIYVINLEFRADRRAEMAEQLARVGLSFDHPKVQLFTAYRPDDQGEFPNIGTRGCFLSHLGVLKDAEKQGHNCILVLEDDADFTSHIRDCSDSNAQRIAEKPWDFFYFGCVLPKVEGADIFTDIPSHQPMKLTHATMLRKAAISGLIPYLETMLTRKLGDPMGGPMHLDGAYGWFRRDHPQFVAMASSVQWMIQRSSKTNIHDTGWKEKIPLINLARRLKNSLARR